MSGRKIYRVFCLLSAVAVASPVHAGWTLKTASALAPPRYQVVTQDGRKSIGGLCVDIMRAIEKVDPEIRFIGDQNTMPQSRLLSLLKVGEVDIAFCYNKNSEREKTFRIIEPALYEIHYKVAVRSNDEVDIRSFNDIRRLGDHGTILVNFGSSSVLFLQSIGGLQIDSSGVTQEINLRKLVNGRGRFYYRHELGMLAELKSSNFAREIRLLPMVLDSEEQYVMFSRSADPLAVERVKKALGKLKASGELDRLRGRY